MTSVTGPPRERPGESVLEPAHESDSVLDDGEAFVGARRRQGSAGEQVDLVGGEDEAATQLREPAVLPALHRGDQRLRLVSGEAPEGGQPLAVTREPDRHDRGRRHLGVERGEVEDGALELGAVVPAWAEHDLGVHADPRLREPLEPREDLGGDARAPEQRVAQLRVGRVDGDVEWREVLLDDALERRLVEVGERDVVAMKERQAEVVVLDVEAPPHPLRQLVDEAEHALVGTGRDLAGAGRLELDTEIGAPSLERECQQSPVPLHPKLELRLARVELEVDRVPEPVAVDRKDPIAPREAGRSGRRPGADAGDDDAGHVSGHWRRHGRGRAPHLARR